MEHRLQNSYTLSVRPSGKKNRQKNENVSYEDSIRKVGTFSTVEQFWSVYSHLPRPGGDTLGRGLDFHLFKDGIKVCLFSSFFQPPALPPPRPAPPPPPPPLLRFVSFLVFFIFFGSPRRVASHKHTNDSRNLSVFTPTRPHTQPIWEDEANRRGGKWSVHIPKGIAHDGVSARYWELVLLSIIGEQFDVGNEVCGAVFSVRFNEDIIAIWVRHSANTDALQKVRDMLYRVLKLPHTAQLDYKPHDKSLHDIGASRLAALNSHGNGGNPGAGGGHGGHSGPATPAIGGLYGGHGGHRQGVGGGHPNSNANSSGNIGRGGWSGARTNSGSSTSSFNRSGATNHSRAPEGRWR